MNLSNLTLGWAIWGVTLVALEFIVPGAILGFLGLAAFIVAGLVHFSIITSLITSITIWFILSIFSILFLRSFALRFMPGDYSVDNTDEDKDSVGAVVEVIEDITPDKRGRVRFRDTTWLAESEETLNRGTTAQIVSRQGSCWIVKFFEQ